MGVGVPPPTIARYAACPIDEGLYLFSYNANEALHLSEHEQDIFIGSISRLRDELVYPIDKYSRSLIIDNVKLLLDQCIRFYDRQFITRENVNNDLLARFEALLDDYYNSRQPLFEGIPTVQWCASKLGLSTNYFSDLVKKGTGQSAIKHIQQKTLDIAKESIVATTRVSARFPTRWASNTHSILRDGSRRWKAVRQMNTATAS